MHVIGHVLCAYVHACCVHAHSYIYSYMPSDVVVADAAFQLNRAVVVQSCSKGVKIAVRRFDLEGLHQSLFPVLFSFVIDEGP